MFKHKGMLMGFAAFSDHCSLFPGSLSAFAAFRDELRQFETAKGTIRFPVDKPPAAALIKKLIRARLAENERKSGRAKEAGRAKRDDPARHMAAGAAKRKNRATQTWVALLRGVNVGGRNKLPMKDLAGELEALGFTSVRTYIQSGNVLFDAPAPRPGRASANTAAAISSSIAASIQHKFGFKPGVMVLRIEDLIAAAAANPFREVEKEPDGKSLHLFFLSAQPEKLDRAALEAVKLPSERWGVAGAVFYLHTPEGFGNSKLAARAERYLGVPATARNWRTICELLKLAQEAH